MRAHVRNRAAHAIRRLEICSKLTTALILALFTVQNISHVHTFGKFNDFPLRQTIVEYLFKCGGSLMGYR